MGIASQTQQECLRDEAMQLLQARLPLCERVLGPGHETVFALQEIHMSIMLRGDPSVAEMNACVTMYKERVRSTRRTFGPSHEYTRQAEELLKTITLALSLGVAGGFVK